MAGMGDIGELLGGQGLVDETGLPDADGAPLEEGGGEQLDASLTEQPQEPQGDPDPYAGKKHVPLGALQEERTRRQETQAQLAQQQQLNQRMQERFNQMMERWQQAQAPVQQQPQQEQQPIPQFIDDPEGHIRAVSERFQQQLDELRQFYQGSVTQQHAAAQGQALAQHTAAAEAEFSKATPDYPKATEYFAQRKLAEYTALGLDPVTAQNALMRDYQGIAITAAQRGQNAAQLIYNLSKAMGYSSQPAAPQTRQTAGKPAPTSLASLGGDPRAPQDSGTVTLESLADMTDAEFEKFFAQMERGSRQRPKI